MSSPAPPTGPYFKLARSKACMVPASRAVITEIGFFDIELRSDGVEGRQRVLIRYPNGDSSRVFLTANAVFEDPEACSSIQGIESESNFTRLYDSPGFITLSLGVYSAVWSQVIEKIKAVVSLPPHSSASTSRTPFNYSWLAVKARNPSVFTYFDRNGELKRSPNLVDLLKGAGSSLRCDVGLTISLIKTEEEWDLEITLANVHVKDLSHITSPRYVDCVEYFVSEKTVSSYLLEKMEQVRMVASSVKRKADEIEGSGDGSGSTSPSSSSSVMSPSSVSATAIATAATAATTVVRFSQPPIPHPVKRTTISALLSSQGLVTAELPSGGLVYRSAANVETAHVFREWGLGPKPKPKRERAPPFASQPGRSI